MLALADELRSPRSLARPRRRTGRAVALVAATAARDRRHRRAARRRRRDRPQDAHGVLQAAAAVAAEQPAPAAYRYTRALDRFVYARQRARRAARPRDRAADLGELDLRRLARPDHRRARQRHVGRAAQRRAAGGGAATSARSSSPTTATTATATGRWRACRSPRSRTTPPRAGRAARGRDPRRALDAGSPTLHPHWAPGVVDSEVARSAVLLLAMGNLDERPAPGAVRAARQRARAPARWARSPTRPGARASASRCACPTSAPSCA